MVVFPQYAHIDIEENLSRPVDVRERVRAEGLTEIEPYNWLFREFEAADSKPEFFRRYWLYLADLHLNADSNLFFW